jgi:tripartite-type tricarboxylate transporter receptor subunit TctC
MIRFAVAACALWAALAGPSALAQSYPTKPIRVIVGYTPGGAADTIARIVTDAMGRQLGATFTIDNKPGAGSTLGSELLARAPADGYTLGLASGTLYGIDQHLYKVKYTPADFTPITRFAISPLILAVNKDLPVRTVGELVAYVKANPGKINYASSGIGGTPHLAALTFEKAIGGQLTHIPYKGGGPAVQAVAQGDVHFSFGTASSVLPLGQQGLVRMLGVSSAQRSPVAPDLPTLSDTGLPGFEFTFWFGLFGPAKLPPDVVDKLFAAATKVLADPDVKTKLLAGGNDAVPSKTPAQFHEAATREGAAQRERAVAAGVSLQ